MTTEKFGDFINEKEVFTNILSLPVTDKNPKTTFSSIKNKVDQKYHLTLDVNGNDINNFLRSVGADLNRIDVGFNDSNNKLSIGLLNGTKILDSRTFILENENENDNE